MNHHYNLAPQQFYTPTVMNNNASPPSGPAPSLTSPMVTPTERQAAFDEKAVELETHVSKMVQHVAHASSKMSEEFILLAAESAEQMNAMLAQTSAFTNVMLQSAAFAEKEADVAVREAMRILQNIQEIHKRTEAAQRLLVESKNLGITVGALEAMLTEMEMRRRMPINGGVPAV